MSDVSAILRTVSDLQAVAVDAIGIAKAVKAGGLKWVKIFSGAIAVANDVGDLVLAAPAALPEFKDLDAEGATQVGGAAFACVSAIVAALKA